MRYSSKIVGFSRSKLYNSMVAIAVEEQTKRLIAYAEKEIKVLGDAIQTYNSANHMDRTGNLLNSLCWVVTYNGKVKGSGFYREPMLRNKGIEGSSSAYLHEFFERTELVDGRKLAEEFIKSREKDSYHGWKVSFAVLASYWGYWESGFKMKTGLGSEKTRFMQFQVLTHIYDDVRMALKPAETHITVYVPKYYYKNKKYKNKVGATHIGVIK